MQWQGLVTVEPLNNLSLNVLLKIIIPSSWDFCTYWVRHNTGHRVRSGIKPATLVYWDHTWATQPGPPKTFFKLHLYHSKQQNSGECRWESWMGVEGIHWKRELPSVLWTSLCSEAKLNWMAPAELVLRSELRTAESTHCPWIVLCIYKWHLANLYC